MNLVELGGDPAGCLGANTAAVFADGGLGEADRGRVLTHLDNCESCRQFVSALVARPDGSPADGVGARLVAPGGLIVGRYRLLELLGAGGQGAVFVAYDCQGPAEVIRYSSAELIRAKAC